MHVFGKIIRTEQHIDQRLKSRSMSVFIKLAFGQRRHGCVRCQKLTHLSIIMTKKKDIFFHITDIDATHIILPDQTKRKMRLQICIFFIYSQVILNSITTHA
jgi:hypothetical protein